MQGIPEVGRIGSDKMINGELVVDNFAGFDIFSVRWDDGGFALYSKWRRFNLRDNNECEVIGNIFDNPELLEVEHE